MRTMLALFALALIAAPTTGHALERDQNGYFHTGDAVRNKKVAFINVKVYKIDHYMKDLPPQKSKDAVVNAETDKAFKWKMLRSVDAEKIRNALREAYAMNGYNDAAKINPFVNSITKELKEGDTVTISYNAANKTTTISSPAGTATVPGEDFMKATWRIWFGKIDQKNLGDQLIENF